MSFRIHINNNHATGFDGKHFFFLSMHSLFILQNATRANQLYTYFCFIKLDCNHNFSNFHFRGYIYSSSENNMILASGMIWHFLVFDNDIMSTHILANIIFFQVKNL